MTSAGERSTKRSEASTSRPLVFGHIQSLGGRLAGLLALGSGSLTAVERCSGHPQRSARRRDADVRC